MNKEYERLPVSHRIANALLDWLDIDKTDVTGISITARVNEPAKIIVERIARNVPPDYLPTFEALEIVSRRPEEDNVNDRI